MQNQNRNKPVTLVSSKSRKETPDCPRETLEQFLARGGKVTQLEPGEVRSPEHMKVLSHLIPVVEVS